MRLTVLPWLLWALIIVASIWAVKKVSAAPLFTAETGEARITLHDDACTVKSVSNLKQRATWNEKGKHYEGCWAVHPAGVILAYFDDGAVVLIPISAFARVSGA